MVTLPPATVVLLMFVKFASRVNVAIYFLSYRPGFPGFSNRNMRKQLSHRLILFSGHAAPSLIFFVEMLFVLRGSSQWSQFLLFDIYCLSDLLCPNTRTRIVTIIDTTTIIRIARFAISFGLIIFFLVKKFTDLREKYFLESVHPISEVFL